MSAYKDTKTNTWYVKFRYRDWTGKPSSTTKRGFRTKKEALAYERTLHIMLVNRWSEGKIKKP